MTAAVRRLGGPAIACLITAGIVFGVSSGRTVTEVVVPTAPAWIAEFATAFCLGPADVIVAHLGGAMAFVDEARAQAALDGRDSPCVRTRYLGYAHGMDADVHLFVLGHEDGEEQWWALTAVGDRIVGID